MSAGTAEAAKLIMLARVPEFGQVKSRLAEHIGKSQALRTHLELLERNAFIAKASGLPFELHVVGDTKAPWFAHFRQRLGVPLHPQGPGDIGAKMLFAAQRCALDSAHAGAASIIIGSDCGGLSVDYLQRAAQRLDQAEVVLGPAEDGGYVLIGQRQPYPDLFSAVSWGTGRVVAQTRELARGAGLGMTELPLQWDVDGVADWRRWCLSKG